jgi:hypothetical protein
MAAPKRLVLFVEGEGDAEAVPLLVKRLLNDIDPSPWDCLFLDNDVMRVGGVPALTGRREAEWARFIGAACRRPRLGGILLVLDGDVPPAGQRVFCPGEVGRDLSRRAREAGAGSLFSVASVFALQEYESWLIGGVESLAGRPLPDGRPGIRAGTQAPDDLERTIRGAKQWLGRHMESRTYKETLDQEALTRLLIEDLGPLRQYGMTSFLRLERALRQLVDGIRSGNHIATPQTPEAAAPEND